MAKGNMLQGMARGKVGDVVFSRLNGEQIARVRNRNPKNPRTNAQLYQRAIMATVMQAYSAGRVIFDHAFQGFGVGEQNQRRFMKLNAKRLRSILANDLQKIDAGTTPTMNGFNAPGVRVPSLNELQISEGTYGSGAINGVHGFPEPEANEKANAYATRVGLIAGDYYTLIGIVPSTRDNIVFEVSGVDSDNARQIRSTFVFVRLKVKDNIGQIETVLTTASKLSVIFDITVGDGTTMPTDATICEAENPEAPWITSCLMSKDNYCACAAGVIHSRLDQDLRSTSFMELVYPDEYTQTEVWGITAKYLLDAWKQGAEKVGDSDLILEGGDV